MSPVNPFRVGGPVGGSHFTNRSKEVTRVVNILGEPQAKLLVYGPRRMGKTSLLRVAVDRIERQGGHAMCADLSTASTLTEMTNRILQAAVQTLGRQWSEVTSDLLKRLQFRFKFEPDPATGVVLPSLDLGTRPPSEDEQRQTLAGVLDTIDALARVKKTTIGIVLDEFQEIHKFGGETAEWHLRGTIQHHKHVSYVLAGSDERLIRAMLGKSRAFYEMLEHLHVGPIDPVHLARWLETRLTALAGCDEGVGERIVTVAGPRTRDIVQLARMAVDVSGLDRPVRLDDVEQAFARTVAEGDDAWRSLWDACSPQQQRVLRAIAVNSQGLTTASVRSRFSLGDTGTTTHAASALVDRGLLTKAPKSYAFDNPFQRGWVLTNTLADIGLVMPATHA